MTDYGQIIAIAPGKRNGVRITVSDVRGSLAAGMYDEIKADFPEITEDDISACLAYADDGKASTSR